MLFSFFFNTVPEILDTTFARELRDERFSGMSHRGAAAMAGAKPRKCIRKQEFQQSRKTFFFQKKNTGIHEK
jgi:hypothetical protein